MPEEPITYKLEGMQEIIDALSSLNSKETLNTIKTIERKILRENIIKPVKAALPYSATTKKGIKIVADKNSGDKTAFFAGATTDAFWLRFVEKGTAGRKGGVGKIRPRPKAIPEIESRPEQIVRFFNEEFGNEVEKILLKKIKKYSS
jgi:hypothetical protein